MNILVVGLGAIGTVFATFLKSAGHSVYGLTKEKYLKILKKGLTVTGIFGDRKVLLDDVVESPQALSNINFDLIIIAVKSFDTEKAISDIKGLMAKDSFLLTAQNGYGNYETAGRILGFDKVILGRVIFGSRLIEHGSAEVTVIADDVIIGNPHRLIDEGILKNIAQMINEAGIPTSYSDRVYQILWDKILYNCALNPLGALLRCNYGKLAEDENARKVMNKIIEEIFYVTKANNIELNWQNKDDYIKHFYEKLIPPTREHFPSMYYDIISNKRTEIDALNGAIVKLANVKNILAPTNEDITLLIKAIEKIKKEER